MNGHKSTVISMWSPKGGCAKTVSVINIAGLLTKEYGKKVLVIDADTSGNLSLGISRSEEPLVTLPELIKQINRMSELDSTRDAICETNFPNLYIIPVTDSDEYIDAVQLMYNNKMDPYHFFKTIIEEVIDDYDFIFFDAVGDAMEINALALNSLSASDFVLQPFNPDSFNVTSIASIFQSIKKVNVLGNPDLKYLGAFMSNAINDEDATKKLHANLIEELGDYYVEHKIRHTANMAKSIAMQMPLCYYVNSSSTLDDYRLVIDELLKKLEAYQ